MQECTEGWATATAESGAAAGGGTARPAGAAACRAAVHDTSPELHASGRSSWRARQPSRSLQGASAADGSCTAPVRVNDGPEVQQGRRHSRRRQKGRRGLAAGGPAPPCPAAATAVQCMDLGRSAPPAVHVREVSLSQSTCGLCAGQALGQTRRVVCEHAQCPAARRASGRAGACSAGPPYRLAAGCCNAASLAAHGVELLAQAVHVALGSAGGRRMREYQTG